jgi:hypothetical protein
MVWLTSCYLLHITGHLMVIWHPLLSLCFMSFLPSFFLLVLSSSWPSCRVSDTIYCPLHPAGSFTGYCDIKRHISQRTSGFVSMCSFEIQAVRKIFFIWCYSFLNNAVMETTKNNFTYHLISFPLQFSLIIFRFFLFLFFASILFFSFLSIFIRYLFFLIFSFLILFHLPLSFPLAIIHFSFLSSLPYFASTSLPSFKMSFFS